MAVRHAEYVCSPRSIATRTLASACARGSTVVLDDADAVEMVVGAAVLTAEVAALLALVDGVVDPPDEHAATTPKARAHANQRRRARRCPADGRRPTSSPAARPESRS